MQDQQFGLRFLIVQMELAHATELLEGLIDVAHTQALARVIGHTPLFLPLHLHLRWQVFVVVVVVNVIVMTLQIDGSREVGTEGVKSWVTGNNK